jgi:hypothetical protein
LPSLAVASLVEIVEGIAAALEPLTMGTPDLQVWPFLNINPTPPSLDVYPGDPFGNGINDGLLYFTVRARVSTADAEAGQRLLLELLEPGEGVEAALTSDQTLGGLVQTLSITPEGVSGIRQYLADTPTGGSLLGCEWRVQVYQS